MWLEIKLEGEVRLINSDSVSYICKSNKSNDLIVFLTDKREVHLKCTDANECAALIQGFILALNGMDFKSEDASMQDSYIKPLKDDANEALYRYMKLKEFLGDRR